jgi:hypothetical protein
MKTNLKPIETFFKGYHFRSRLEARWAVFFEEMGFDWTYEPEGFELPSGAWYLPDFLVKNREHCYDYWYEIKPKGSTPCPKVIEFENQLSSATDVYARSPNWQHIVQLNGDPIEAISTMCPRCKKIASDDDNFNYSFLREVIEVTDNKSGKGQTCIIIPTPHKYNCDFCDCTKICESGDSVFDEKNAFKHKGFQCDLHWHKGEMEETDPWLWTELYRDLFSSMRKARQARFNGRAVITS